MAHRSDEPTRTILVWDLPTRLFHWLLVLGIFGAWLTAVQGEDLLDDLEMLWHKRIGLFVLGLLVFRLVWGVIGSATARLSTCINGPRTLLDYLKAVRAGAPSPIGHNPMGGWMVIAMLMAWLVQALTGLVATDDILASGPLANDVPTAWSSFLGGWHTRLFYWFLALIALHVLAIVAYRVVKGENLVRPMITGRRTIPVTLGDQPALAGVGPLLIALAAGIAVPVGIKVMFG